MEIRLQVGQVDCQNHRSSTSVPRPSGRRSGRSEYGFWANVNPAVPHPRWSQARETFLNDGQQRPTLIYNGYGAEVASLYKGLEKEPLFM